MRTLLIDSVSGITEIQFLDIPSFAPERVLLIKRDGDNYMAILRRPSRSIWYSQFEDEKSEIEIINFEKEIDLEMVEVLKCLYESVLRNLKVHNDESWTADAGNFYFSANLPGLRTGTTKSPKRGSKMEELVHINEEIIRLVEKTKGSEIIFSKELIDRIRSLEKEIEN
ncbi:MAG: hypothetical protein KTR26_09605 [Flammeovirgaceae bacterium]|nr:hypothetical protein [Flammeovirgaceae bacterium]